MSHKSQVSWKVVPAYDQNIGNLSGIDKRFMVSMQKWFRNYILGCPLNGVESATWRPKRVAIFDFMWR